MRALLLEDDPVLGSGLRDFLRAEGHVVDWCTRVDQLRTLRGEPFDVWLVDWQLPDGSGLDWLRARRAAGDATPAIVLTARDQLRHRIEGLDGGADDYLVKPFAPEELAARMRVIGRRSAASGAGLVRVGEVELDIGARLAMRQGTRVDLTGREWAVLECLLMRRGRIVPRQDIERVVLGFDGELSSNAVEVHISALRRKLGHGLIETSRGLGYRIDAA